MLIIILKGMEKMNTRKCFIILSSLVIAVVLIYTMTIKVNAAVESYVVKDNDRIIRFNLDSLTKDYTNNLLGRQSPMFDEYMNHVSQLTAFEDTIKGLVSYDAVLPIYVDLLKKNKGNEFNINSVTENASDEDMAKGITVNYEWNNGNIIKVDETSSEFDVYDIY